MNSPHEVGDSRLPLRSPFGVVLADDGGADAQHVCTVPLTPALGKDLGRKRMAEAVCPRSGNA